MLQWIPVQSCQLQFLAYHAACYVKLYACCYWIGAKTPEAANKVDHIFHVAVYAY